MANEIVPEIDYNLFSEDLSLDDIKNLTNSQSNPPEVKDTTKNNKGFNVNDVDEIILDPTEVDLLSTVKEQQSSSEDNVGNQPNDQGQEYPEDLYSLLFDFVKEQNILDIPDDIEVLDQEKLQWVIDQNNQKRQMMALDEVRNRAGDDKVAELFDFVYNGGTWEDINNMRELIQVEDDYDKLDTANEQDQRFLIESFLKEGLDPKNPAHKRRLDGLDEEIEKYMERLEGESIAKEAKEYFVGKINQEKERLHLEKEDRIKKENENRDRAAKEEAKWINDFKSSLDGRKWSQDKKQNVIKQFDIVKLDNGNEVEMWRYKWNQMWKKPELVHVFMDFLSNLDPYTMTFKGEEVNPEKKITQKLLDMASKKQSVPSKQVPTRRDLNQKKENQQITLDPRDFI